MVNTILNGLPHKEGRFPDPPAVTYAVWFDDVEASGADRLNCIYTHAVTVELYEPTKDEAAESAIESALNEQGIHWTKQARYWLDSIRRYQVIYEFTYYEKRRA